VLRQPVPRGARVFAGQRDEGFYVDLGVFDLLGVGSGQVDTALPPMMGAEDFSFMLNARPGAFIWVGNGESAGLHHPAYNFNDDVIPLGAGYLAALAEQAMPLATR